MSAVLMEVSNGVAFITLNRPEKLNSFNREMALMLQCTLDECAKDKMIRAVLITGAGTAFSAGQDLSEAADKHGPGLERILSEQLNPVVLKLINLEKPVVAAINGVAAGAGVNIALNCDIVVAASSASLIQAFSKIGLIPDSGGTYILPRLIGWQRASALMMLAKKISAAEAELMGMIYKVFTDDSFKDEAVKIAVELAQMPTKALALTKMALRRSADNSMEDQLRVEDKLQQLAAATNDYAEGVSAFLEKRRASFTGE